jgi:hypothetical protein
VAVGDRDLYRIAAVPREHHPELIAGAVGGSAADLPGIRKR